MLANIAVIESRLLFVCNMDDYGKICKRLQICVYKKLDVRKKISVREDIPENYGGMIKMKRMVVLLFIVLLIVSSVAYFYRSSLSNTSQNNNAAESKAIVIGVLQDITGPTSTLGQMVEAGAKWGANEINVTGGIGGRPFQLITYDTKGDVNEAINAFTRAVTTDKVTAIIGPPVANIALAIAPISEQYDVPVVGFAMDVKCQIKGDNTPYKNMFAFQPNANQQGATMAQYAMKNGFNTYGVIYNEGNAYSVSLKDPFIATVVKGGGTVAEVVPYTTNDRDFKTLLGKIIAKNVDAIFVPNYTQDLILIVQQARALGFEGALICGLDACPPFNKLFGEDCDNVYFINNVDDTEPHLQEMIADVKAKTGIDATNKFFLGYDVVNIVAQIIDQVGDNPVKVCKAVKNLSGYKGLTGTITINSETHMPVDLEMVMFTYEGITPKILGRYSAE